MKTLATPPEMNSAKKDTLVRSIIRNFYERHGFVRESFARLKIRNIAGKFEPDVTSVRFNPNFSEDSLNKYHAFLRLLIRESLN